MTEFCRQFSLIFKKKKKSGWNPWQCYTLNPSFQFLNCRLVATGKAVTACYLLVGVVKEPNAYHLSSSSSGLRPGVRQWNPKFLLISSKQPTILAFCRLVFYSGDFGGTDHPCQETDKLGRVHY